MRHQPTALGIGTIAVLAALAVGSPGGAQDRTLERAAQEVEPNPYLAFLPVGSEPDYASWRRALQRSSRGLRRGAVSAIWNELEAPGELGRNDVAVDAETPVPGSLAPGGLLRIEGHGLRPQLPLLPPGDPGGSLPSALDLEGLGFAAGGRFTMASLIGDGPHGSGGSGSGDVDVFRFVGVSGQRLDLEVRTPDPQGDLDPFLAVFDDTGRLLGLADEIVEGGFFVSRDARLSLRLPLDGTVFVMVGGSSPGTGAGLPADLDDPSSGPGVVSEGDYDFSVSLDAASMQGRDLYAIDLEPGDVVGVTVREGSGYRVSLLDPWGGLLVSSGADLSALYPETSPLPGGGSASLAWVASRGGRHLLALTPATPFATATYAVEVALHPAPPAGGASGARVLHLDFDGAVVDRNAFFSLPSSAGEDPVVLSPLRDFLHRWGLPGSRLDDLIDAVVEVVRAEIDGRVRQLGGNGDFGPGGEPGRFDIEVHNSRDHPLQPTDAVVVVGGTTEELRLQTVGIAEAIDPGDFAAGKVAVVLLDLLSGAAGGATSLNSIAVADGVDTVELVATALGRIASHEAGHLFGNFHTERDLGPATLMDSGGRLGLLLGLGDDGVYGSADDGTVHFDTDRYSTLESFDGWEECLEVISFGLPRGVGGGLRVQPATLGFGAVPVGTAGSATLFVHNDGAGTVALPVVGPEAPFAVLSAVPASLFPGTGASIELGFAPAAVGAFADAVGLGPAEASVAVALSGQGGIGALESVPSDTVELPRIEYGSLESTRAGLLVRNTGDTRIELLTLIGGAQGDRFTVVDAGAVRGPASGPLVLASGEERALTVVFDPGGAVGKADASLTLSDAAGTVATRVLALRSRSDGPDLRISPRPYVFGSRRPDGASATRTFRLRNEGTRRLSVGSARLLAGSPDVFDVSPPSLPLVLEPLQETGIAVTFRPDDAIRYDGTLVVESDDPDEPEARVAMVGFGVLPQLEVWPDRIVVDRPSGGQVTEAELLLSNAGGATLRGQVSLEDPGGGWSVQPPEGEIILSPGATRRLLLRHRAPASGEVRTDGPALLVVESDDVVRPRLEVPLIVGGVTAVPLPRTTWTILAILLAVAAVLRLGRGG